MPSFGWRELGLLLVVLSALTVLLRSGNPGTDPVDPASASTDEASARTTATYPTIAATASRELAPPEKPGDPPRTTASSLTTVPRADEAQREWSIPPPRPALPVPGRAAAKPATVPVPAPVPAPAEKFWADCTSAGGLSSVGRIFFPLPAAHLDSYGNTWGAPRPQGGHEGTDLMVPAGTPELAVTDGTIVPVAGSNANGWNSLGGYAVMLRADYSVGPIKAGDLFYYAHMNARSHLPVGARVRAGQVLGYAGDTGQGPEVTRGLFPPHLHFGWYDAAGAQTGTGVARSALPSGAINPYPMLAWIESNGAAGGADAGRCAAPGVGAPVPTTAPPATGDRWPADDSPGLGPDLDTGSGNPNPAPAPAAPAARETAPQATPDHAQAKAPTQRDPREEHKPTREAATPEPGTGTPEREPPASAAAGPSASATAGPPASATAGLPASAKPPERPTPGPQTQTPQPPQPAKPKPTREPGAQDPSAQESAQGPGSQEPGAVDPSRPAKPVPPASKPAPPVSAKPVPPATGDDTLPRPGLSSEATVEIEEPENSASDVPARPDPEASVSDLPPGEREDVIRREVHAALEDVQGMVVEKGNARASGTAEAAEE